MKYQECYRKGKVSLTEAGVEEAVLDARLLLEYVCGTDRSYMLVHGDNEVSAEQEEAYFANTGKRSQRIPLQYITGRQNFMGLDFEVNQHVLIPRQDTEILVEEVLRQLNDGDRILDMCTGSGCILISLLRYSNRCEGVGADISMEALNVANRNAKALLTDGVLTSDNAGTYRFVWSDLFENVTGQFDIIVSNPPYIKTDVIDTLMPEVKDFEPRQALDGTEDGLYFYRRIVEESRKYLTVGGMLYFEVGYDQAPEVSGLMKIAGFQDIQVVKDYAGLDRVVFGRWPG